MLIAHTPILSITAATYYFLGATIRQSQIDFAKIFRPSAYAFLLWGLILIRDDKYNWEFVAVAFSSWCCISSLIWLRKYFMVAPHNRMILRMDKLLLYIGRNTLPVYLFHPIFTMAAKYYHPLFAWDKSEIIFSICTIILAITGSLGIARLMEITKVSYIFGKEKILR